MKSAALVLDFTVFFGRVVLFTIFAQPVMSGVWAPEFIEVVRASGGRIGALVARCVQVVDERVASFVAMLALGVGLCAALAVRPIVMLAHDASRIR